MSENRRNRTSGGSRYADKRTASGGRRPSAGAVSMRGNGRAVRRRKKHRQQIVVLLLLFALVLAGCAGAVFFFTQRKQMSLRSEQEANEQQIQEQLSVNLDVLASPYAVLMDGETGSVLASKRGDEKIFPASMAKIMTVYTAIQAISDLDRTTVMSYDFYDALYKQDASRAGFEPGEEAVIRDLLYGALLPSGAECCMQLAIEASGSEASFADLMNQKALEMGLTQTHFTNATGLHNEEQFSTAHEIGKILQTALKNDVFRKVFTTHYYTVQPTSVHPDGFTFWSTMFKNMEQDTVNGGEIMGGKTGYTDEAGHCLASMAEVNGHEYILVTAGWAQTDSALYHIEDAFAAYNQIAE